MKTVIWTSTSAGTALYALVGLFGAAAFDACPDNMLELLGSPAVPRAAQLASLAFGVLIVGLGIPIFCILMRYNLVVGGVCSPAAGLFAGGLLPWLLSWLAYTGHAERELLSWTGLTLSSFINFVCPALVAAAAAAEAAGALRAGGGGVGGEGAERLDAAKGPRGGYGAAATSDPAGQTSEGPGGGVALPTRTGAPAPAAELRTIPPTVVDALPAALRPHHERVVAALLGAIVVLVGIGLVMKVNDASAPSTGL